MQSPAIGIFLENSTEKSDKDAVNVQIRCTLLPCWTVSSISWASQRAQGFAFDELGVTAQSSLVARSGQTTKWFACLVSLTRSLSTRAGRICGHFSALYASRPPVLIVRAFWFGCVAHVKPLLAQQCAPQICSYAIHVVCLSSYSGVDLRFLERMRKQYSAVGWRREYGDIPLRNAMCRRCCVDVQLNVRNTAV